jgi:hypothetical protein
MGTEAPNDIDRAAIAEHAQRTAEQSALRKIRRALDGIKETESVERRILSKVLVVCALLAGIAVLLIWGLMFTGGTPKAPPMNVPATLQPKP